MLKVTQYLTNHLWECHPSYNFDAVWDKDKPIAHVEVKGQGHGETIYGQISTLCRIFLPMSGIQKSIVMKLRRPSCSNFLFLLIRCMRFERVS